MSESSPRIEVVSPFQPAGDQPVAIDTLVEGLEAGLAHQTLLGVTGSGKTFSIANVISRLQRPALIMAPNKTLAAQLYGEFKEFFPNNSVEYFVSYYDYYQPEAYVRLGYLHRKRLLGKRPHRTNALIRHQGPAPAARCDHYRLSIGHLRSGRSAVLSANGTALRRGDRLAQRDVLRRLTELQYERNDVAFQRGTYRVRGDVIDVFPAESEKEAVRIGLFDDEIEEISIFDPLTGEVLNKVPRYTIFPKSHYVTPRERVVRVLDEIKEEMVERVQELTAANKLVEAQRLEQRTRFDLEMIQELGYCSGSKITPAICPGGVPAKRRQPCLTICPTMHC